MASILPASSKSMGSNRNKYVGKSFVHVKNPFLDSMDEDILYHLDLGTKTHNLPEMFGDVKHGMGIPSTSIMLHELIKLLHQAQRCDVTLIRIGIAPGSVVITDTAVDFFFMPAFEQVILDNIVTQNTELYKELAEELFKCSKEIPNLPALTGHTMCTYDFYEAAVVCVTLLDRLECDQINLPHKVLVEYQQRPQLLITKFIKQRLGLCDQTS